MAEILLHHACLPAALPGDLEERWLAALPAQRAARLRRVREAPGRLATLLGIALLLDCVRTAGLAAPEPGALQFPPRGKPRWPAGPDFSISHAGGRVACALAPPGVLVGLDIEPRHTVARTDLRLVATARELDDYAAAGLTPTDVWAAKEAVLKAAGADIATLGRIRLDRSAAYLRGQRYLLRRPRLARDCSCTLATTRSTGLAIRQVVADVVLRALA